MRLLLILLLSFFVLQFLYANYNLLQTPSYDHVSFYAAGGRVLDNQNPYQTGNTQPIRYPPTALLIFAFFSFFPLVYSQFIFFFMSLVAICAGSIILFKTIRDLDPKSFKKFTFPEVFLIYSILLVIFFPFRYLLSSLHIHSLIFLLLSMFIYFLINKKCYFAGLFLALAGSITVTPFVMLVVLLIQKRLSVILYTLQNSIFIFVITTLLLGEDIYYKFLPDTTNTLDFGITAYYNQSITAFLSRLFDDQTVVRVITLLAAGACLGILAIISLKMKYRSNQIDLIGWIIGILSILLFAPFSWQYHYILTIIPFIFLYYIFKKNNFSGIYPIVLFTAYILIGFNIKNPNIIKLPLDLELFALTHVFLGGLILLVLSYFTFKKLAARG